MLHSEDSVDKRFSPYVPKSLDRRIHPDHLGTPHKMTDSTGTVVWSAYYKPFGAATITVSTITNNLRFPGQYYDAETGLNYNLNRDYNQSIGRYIEVDPIGIEEGENHLLYVYAENNPLSNIDRLGLFTYNTSNTKITGRLKPDIAAKVSFLEICLATDLVVTGGWESHGGGALGPHGRGEAVDFSFDKNPQLPGMKDKFMCCAKRMGFNYALYEPIPPQFHIQISTGTSGGSGDLPDCCKKPECCK
jgi:RHS repeat-associated protein